MNMLDLLRKGVRGIMNKMRKRLMIVGSILLIMLVFTPKMYAYLEEVSYNKNYLTIITAFSEITVLDTYTEGDDYYLKFSYDSQMSIDKYKIKDNIRTYKLADKDLYDKIDLKLDYAGLVIETILPRKSIPEDELRKFELDPLLILSNQAYSKYIKVINLGESNMK
ncbi:hypothetical protein D3C73_579780 [compost metagenome]